MRNRCNPKYGVFALAVMALTAVTCWAAPATDLARHFQQAGVAPLDKPLKAPDFTLPTLAGESVRLSDLEGRLVVLNFWATWCPPCIKEMPSLERLGDRFRDRVTVLAVSLDMGNPASVAAFVNGYGWKLPVLVDSLTEVGDAYQVQVMPTTYLIGLDGQILGRAFGARSWDSPEAVALLEQLLNTPPVSTPTS